MFSYYTPIKHKNYNMGTFSRNGLNKSKKHWHDNMLA